MIRGTKAVQLLQGIIVIVIVRMISGFLGLNTVEWLMEQTMTWGVLAIIIIFQPELRRALEQLGRGLSRGSSLEEEQNNLVDILVQASDYMAKRRIGALISIERDTGLGDYIETGISMDADISSELLINVFIPNTPLHDGAVIIQKEKIAAAACFLPLSESAFISKELGTRHRAAIGISEVTDCITIVVSEETGAISLTKNSELHRQLELDHFRELLEEEFAHNVKVINSSRWQWRGKKNG